MPRGVLAVLDGLRGLRRFGDTCAISNVLGVVRALAGRTSVGYARHK